MLCFKFFIAVLGSTVMATIEDVESDNFRSLKDDESVANDFIDDKRALWIDGKEKKDFFPIC